MEVIRLFFETLAKSESALLIFVRTLPILLAILLVFRFIFKPVMEIFKSVVATKEDIAQELHKLQQAVLELKQSNDTLVFEVRQLLDVFRRGLEGGRDA